MHDVAEARGHKTTFGRHMIPDAGPVRIIPVGKQFAKVVWDVTWEVVTTYPPRGVTLK